jgi:glutathione S-transferase
LKDGNGDMLKIWGRANSVNVQKVLWCCDELGLGYERVDVGGAFGGNREPDYLRMNPNALVPTVADEGLVLWESNTVVRYLAAKHGMGSLCPHEWGARALVERWMDWQLSTVHGPMATIFIGLIRTPAEKRDMKAIEAARQAMGEIWSRLDRHLADRAFIGGDTLTMGDIPAGCFVYRWFNLAIERNPLPHLRAWYDRLTARPAYRQHVMITMT